MLRHRILWLVAFALAPAVAIQGYNEFALRSARETTVREDTLRLAQATADDLAEIGDTLRQVLHLMAVDRSVRAKDSATCAAHLEAASAGLPGVVLLALTEPDGRVICNSRGSRSGSYTNAERAYHKRAIETGAIAVGDYVEGVATGKASVHIAGPLRDPGGGVTGVLVVALDLAWLSERLTRSGLAPDTAVSVIDSKGRVLVRVPASDTWVGRQIAPDRLAIIEANVGRSRDAVAWDGRRSIVAIARPPGFMAPLTVSVGRDRATLFADIDTATWRGILLIPAGAVLATAAALFSGRALIRRPLDRLIAAAAAWRRGELGGRTGVSGPSEFGRLGEAFDGMAEALQKREGELRQEIAHSRALQARQVTMLHELNHRVKNTLATVQSLARQVRGGESGAHDLEKRVIALSKTHDLLTRDEWTGAPLRAILENELHPYRRDDRHVVLNGPEIELPPRYVLALGMTFHELTTNAAKYGALSDANGHVEVTWDIVPDGTGAQRLRVRWQESGGPPVTPPTRRGFGTRLITGGSGRELGGEVSLDYEPAGFRCRIDVPLDDAPRPA